MTRSLADAGLPGFDAQTARRLPAVLLAVFLVEWTALAWHPVNRQDWLLENLLVFIAIPVFIATRHRMRFSNGAYLCLFVFFSLHAIGAHYTYSLVPYASWFGSIGLSMDALIDPARNHYDRFIHFLYGALMLLPSVELLERYAPMRSAWRWVLPVTFVASHSVVYEIVEWIAAIIVAPELGDAYLGTQGDVWDAQKDMALAAAGAIVASVLRYAWIKLNASSCAPECHGASLNLIGHLARESEARCKGIR